MGAESTKLDDPGLERVFFAHKSHQGRLSFAALFLIGQPLIEDPPSQGILGHVADDENRIFSVMNFMPQVMENTTRLTHT